MHAGTKKRTGWNPRRGSSPFVRKNAKQIGIFQKNSTKKREKSFEISRFSCCSV